MIAESEKEKVYEQLGKRVNRNEITANESYKIANKELGFEGSFADWMNYSKRNNWITDSANTKEQKITVEVEKSPSKLPVILLLTSVAVLIYLSNKKTV